MDWRLFLSTFGLFLIAELGDKTQLVAVVAAASSRSPWTIFAGASVALTVTVGVSVIIGYYLQRVLPLNAIQFVAGMVFIAFGIFSLYRAFRPSREILAVSARQEISDLDLRRLDFISRLTLRAALDFEDAAKSDYRLLAARAQAPKVRELFLWLAREDGKHHAFLEALSQGATRLAEVAAASSSEPEVERPSPASSAGQDIAEDLALLEQSARHEAGAQQFYENLARSSLGRSPRLSSFFRRLALDEQRHLDKILLTSRSLQDENRLA